MTVLKLLGALSKSSTRLSDHLNFARSCLLVLACHFIFHRIFLHSNSFILLVFFHQSTHVPAHRQTELNDHMKRAGSVNRLISCNSESTPTKRTTGCRFGFKMMQNSVPSQKRASSPHVITSLIFYSVAKFHTCWNIELSIIEFNIQWQNSIFNKVAKYFIRKILHQTIERKYFKFKHNSNEVF